MVVQPPSNQTSATAKKSAYLIKKAKPTVPADTADDDDGDKDETKGSTGGRGRGRFRSKTQRAQDYAIYKANKEQAKQTFALIVAHYPGCRRWKPVYDRTEKKDDLADAVLHAIFLLKAGGTRLARTKSLDEEALIVLPVIPVVPTSPLCTTSTATAEPVSDRLPPPPPLPTPRASAPTNATRARVRGTVAKRSARAKPVCAPGASVSREAAPVDLSDPSDDAPPPQPWNDPDIIDLVPLGRPLSPDAALGEKEIHCADIDVDNTTEDTEEDDVDDHESSSDTSSDSEDTSDNDDGGSDYGGDDDSLEALLAMPPPLKRTRSTTSSLAPRAKRSRTVPAEADDDDDSWAEDLGIL